MRNSIKEHTIAFKQSNMLKCCSCSIADLDYKNYHADHKTKPFSLIMEQFLKMNKFEHLTFDDSSVMNGAIFKQNEKFKYNWIDYHNQQADYQILCESCNSKKGNKILLSSKTI